MTKIINNMTAKRFLSLFLAIVMTVVLIPITGVSAEENCAIDNSLSCPHTSTKRINAIEETCTTNGYTGDIVCADCGELIEEGDPILTLGHSSDVRGAVDATCTTDGATGESYCDWCGEVFEENTVIPAFGHTWDDGVTNDTVKTFTCLTCGETYTENHEHTPAEKFVDATCTKDGSITTYCTDCGQVLSEEIIPAKGHTPYNDLTYYVTVPPTCYEDGSITIYCSVCQGVASFEILPARNHMRDETTEAWGEEFVSKYPTVDEVGYFSQECGLRGCDAVRVTREIERLRDADIMVIDGVMIEYLGDSGKVKLPGNVTAIADGAFEGSSTVTELVIHSGVTSIGDGAFADMTALETVKFMGSEEEWNEIEKADGFDEGTDYDMEYKELGFIGASVTLNSDLRVNYKADGSLFDDCYDSPYVVFTMCGEEIVVEDYTIQDGNYVFSYDGISPAMMGENIEAVLYASYDGVEVSAQSRDYSIVTYCRNLLRVYTSDSYATVRTLLVDMLNYGTASQNYVGYNTDAPANGKLTEAQAAFGTKEVREYESLFDKDYTVCESPAAEWKSAGLILGDSVTMRFKLDADCIDELTIKIVGDGGEWTVTSDELFEEADGGCYVYFDGYNASQMSDAVYVTAYIGDTAVSNTLRYSIESYAASKMGENTELTELLCAMMKYGDAAAAFAG